MKSKLIITEVFRIDYELYLRKDQLKDSEFYKALNHPNFYNLSIEAEIESQPYSSDHAEIKIIIRHAREETKEETKTRYAKNRKKKLSAKKAAKTRAQKKLEKEKAQYEKLKKKFEL